MATFLELCKDTARECDIAGTGPSAVTGQTGESADVVRWVTKSYTEIQNRNGAHWRWLRHTFTINTTASDGIYTFSDATDTSTAATIDRFSSWRFADPTDRPKIYLNSSGKGTERWLSFVKWESFKSIYLIGTQNDGSPAHIAIDPEDKIHLGSVPNGIYVVTGDYYRSAQTLAADGDIPEMPVQFHDLIMWYAIEHYGYREAASEVLARAEKKQRKFMRQLEANQLDRFRKARPLA